MVLVFIRCVISNQRGEVHKRLVNVCYSIYGLATRRSTNFPVQTVTLVKVMLHGTIRNDDDF